MFSLSQTIRTVSLIGVSLFAATIAWAVSPPPDGGYAGYNTAEGTGALLKLETGAIWNTAVGAYALFSDGYGSTNTAVGTNALRYNDLGSNNTALGVYTLFNNKYTVTYQGVGAYNVATGFQALLHNTDGTNNTATGYAALYSNEHGHYNTATGANALLHNVGSQMGGSPMIFVYGYSNTATGYNALLNNVSGNANTATGVGALSGDNEGDANTATGSYALAQNTTGYYNVAEGSSALANNTTGIYNIALGSSAGSNLTTGSFNIDIGHSGIAGEANTIRIGGNQTNTFMAGISGVTIAGGVSVIIDSSGHLGTVTSSARYKENIQPMDTASEAILALQPVTFRYKHTLDPAAVPQFGLVAEQVEKVSPDLVARDEQGKPYTVRYEAVNAMLLNEFLKEHRKVAELEATVAKQDAGIAQQYSVDSEQQKSIEALTAILKNQAAQIQKVSDQLRTQGPPPRVVADN